MENTDKHQARINDVVERQRNGTWDGVPHGWHVSVDSDGHKRLHKNAVVNAAETQLNNDCVGSDEENPQLLMLGGLGEALDVLLNDGGMPLVNKGDASPLPSWRGDDEDPNNEVD